MHDTAPLVDLTEAVREGWLELWYQPKIDAVRVCYGAIRPVMLDLARHCSTSVLPNATT